MHFKIEINYLNIDNYPNIETHLEERASKGWRIDKIILGTFFIYEKIEPQALDFSISPYEAETFFTRKAADDLKEFQSVSERVGWNYATKSYDLHIYYKAEETEAVPLHTDEEEEFKLLERIAKRYLSGQYLAFPILLLASWFIIGGLFNNIHSMKDGMTQIIALMLPIGIMLSLVHIFDLRKFLKVNRRNLEVGRSLTFNDTHGWLYTFTFSALVLLLLALVFYLFYSALVLKNLRALVTLSPLVVGGLIGLMYRAWIKPLRKGLGFKVGAFAVTLVLAALVGIPLGWANYNLFTSNQGLLNPDEYRVLREEEVAGQEEKDQGNLTRSASLLVPQSHDYSSHPREEGVRTEYADALNEPLAARLVRLYKQQAENRLRGNYSREVDQSFTEGDYHPKLKTSGLTEDDFYRLYHRGSSVEITTIWRIAAGRSIRDANELWQVDEAYFLTYARDAVVVREGTEVFYLAGLDFSDPSIIEQAKTQLQIDR